MNAIEEIAKTQPKENAGAPTSKRFEYQMNWGLSKLLELEEKGEDYTIAFDYHDDIIVFNSEANATEVDFYQVKTKTNGQWRLGEIYNPSTPEDESDKEKGEDETKKEEVANENRPKKKKLSYLAKLLSHTRRITTSRNFFFVTNRQFSKNGFEKAPKGKLVSFADIKKEKQDEIKEALRNEIKELDVSHTENFYILQDQIPLDGFQNSLRGAVSEFLKKNAGNAEIDADVFYSTLLHQIIRTRNNYDADINDVKQFLEKKCFTKSQFSALIKGLSNLESFNFRCQTITTWLRDIPPFEADGIRKQLSELRKDMTSYGNLSLLRMFNKIRDVIENNEFEREDSTYVGYAERMVGILKNEMPEALNYEDNYLIALTLYEKSKL